MTDNGHGLGDKMLKDGKDLVSYAERIKKLFAEGNRKEFEKALSQGDFGAACKALRVSEDWLVGLFKQGKFFADELAAKHPEFKAAAKRKAAGK